jgi:hypothetical protein
MAVLFLALFLALAFLAAILSTSLLEWAGDSVILPCDFSFSRASAAAEKVHAADHKDKQA